MFDYMTMLFFVLEKSGRICLQTMKHKTYGRYFLDLYFLALDLEKALARRK